MKNTPFIIIGLAITCFTLKAKACQQDTAYKQNSELKKFDGTWEYVDSNVTFKIVLKTKKKFLKDNNVFIDQVEGHHYLIKNNKLVQNGSSLGREPIISGNIFYDFITKAIPKNTIRFIFIDLERRETEDGRIEILSENRLRWTLKNFEHLGFVKKGEKGPDFSIHVPNDVILTKIK